MKTNLKTLIGIVALGTIGLTSNHANAGTTDTLMQAMNEKRETLSMEGSNLENGFYAKTKEVKAAEARKAEKAEAEKALEAETQTTNEDFLKAAESYTASTSDKEVEKYAARQIALQEEKKGK